jgi:tetratricopeptide (TPR) repeat protein
MQISTFVIVILLSVNLAIAQDESSPGQDAKLGVDQKIEQKLKMVDHILHSPDLLQRVEQSDDSVAKDLLARAAENYLKSEEYYGRGLYLEAEAVLDYVLRDLAASSRLLSVPQQKRNEVVKFLEQLDSFALPEWGELTEQENDLLQNQLTRVSELRDRAIRHADVNSYDKAIALLEEAYQLKVSLIDTLKHETTIVYDLNFDTIQDEYQYMSNRTYHYLELVQMALSESDIPDPTRKLTDKYVYGSMQNLEQAETLETQGQFSEAILMLEKTINQLSSVLKILGINI